MALAGAVDQPADQEQHGQADPLCARQVERHGQHVGAAADHDRNRDGDAHQCLTGDQAGGEQHARLVHAVAAFFVIGAHLVEALDQVGDQAAEEDRHHQFQRQVDADGGGQHRHAEAGVARLQPAVEGDDGGTDHGTDADEGPRQFTTEQALGHRGHQVACGAASAFGCSSDFTPMP
jgi:hypothetical protein